VDAAIVLAELPGWEFFEAKDGALTLLVDANVLRPDINSLWCKRANVPQWELELMLGEMSGDHWIFRRDARS
jgi:hypothetical protein